MAEDAMTPKNLRAWTFRRYDISDFTLNTNLPKYSSRHQRPRMLPQHSLGILETLPNELIDEILLEMDLRSLLNLRYTNKKAAELVDSFKQFKTIVRHASSALRGIIRVQSGEQITCKMLYQKLYTSACEECGDFAVHLYVITCKRLCFPCFTRKPSYFPLPEYLIEQRYGLNRQQINALPKAMLHPGVYSLREVKIDRSIAIVDYDSIVTAATAHHGSLEAVKKYTDDVRTQIEERASRGEPALETPTNPPYTCTLPLIFPEDSGYYNPVRFLAVVTLPSLSHGSAKPDWGFYCEGCKNQFINFRSWRQKFNRASYAKHLRERGIIYENRHKLLPAAG